MKILNIFLFSYLLINITALNYYSGSYIFSSAWTTGGEAIDVNCLPSSAKFSENHHLIWNIENRSECQDSQMQLQAFSECNLIYSVKTGIYSDVYACGALLSNEESTGYTIQFLANYSMIVGYTQGYTQRGTVYDYFPSVMAYNYLFIPKFSYSDGDTFKLQAAYDMLDLESDWEQLFTEDYESRSQQYQDIIGKMLDKIASMEVTVYSDSEGNTLNSTYLKYVNQYLHKLDNNSLSITMRNLSIPY